MLLDRYSLRFGEVNSADYGIYVFGGGIYNKPKRRVTKYTVPGRSGELTVDENAFDNVEVTYQAIVTDNFGTRFNQFIDAMYAQTGYQRLEDTFDLEHFRQGLFCQALNPKPGVNSEYGTFEMKFDCKPQRWLKSGEELVDITIGATGLDRLRVKNPTHQTAYPLIYCYGSSGEVQISEPNIGNMYCRLANMVNPPIIIDCELEDMQGYHYTTTMTTGYTFPRISPVEHDWENAWISATGFSSCQIQYRWWDI